MVKDVINMPMVSFQPPVRSVRLEDIFDVIDSKIVIMKMDIEGYECKALPPGILKNETGQFVPLIFMEWVHLRHSPNCPRYKEFVQSFIDSGYQPTNPGYFVILSFQSFLYDAFSVHIQERINISAYATEIHKWNDVLWIHQTVDLTFNNTFQEYRGGGNTEILAGTKSFQRWPRPS